MPNQSPRVQEIGRPQLAEAVRLLGRAFADDPLMRYIFAEAGDYPTRLREFFQYSCEVHLRLGWPILGVVPRTRLAGLVAVALPEQRPWPDELTEWYNRWTSALGRRATDRIERYAKRTNPHFPDDPLFYIGMIGVRPESRGQGYARQLLEEVHRRSEQHACSTGVALDTENATNVAIYERLGYRVVARDRLGDLTVWCMFRPNNASS
jgi:ribosomal protein S18 acetylase RimI-like enzyme